MVLYAKEVVEPEFLSMSPETTALEAARVMKERHRGYVIVSRAEKPIGIVTEWDYLSKLVAQAKDPAQTTLGELMTEGLVSVAADEGIESVARIMTERGVRRVLVLKDDKVVGVITARTILSRFDEYVDKISTTIARLQAPPTA